MDPNYSNTLFPDVARAYWDEISNFNPLPKDEQNRLMTLIKAGDLEARDTFIESFLRLVVARAKIYCRDFESFMDMVQEGNVGLMIAINRFDPSKGCCFSTYATWWIDKYIRKESCRTKRPIHIPYSMTKKINHILACEAEFTQINNREPTSKELAEIVHMDVEEVKYTLSLIKPPVSLDYEEANEYDSLQDFIIDHDTMSPEESAIAEDMKKILTDFMKNNLSELEYKILMLRFGIGSGIPDTLQSVSAKCGLSIEGTRKHEMCAIKKLSDAFTACGLTMADFVP